MSVKNDAVSLALYEVVFRHTTEIATNLFITFAILTHFYCVTLEPEAYQSYSLILRLFLYLTLFLSSIEGIKLLFESGALLIGCTSTSWEYRSTHSGVSSKCAENLPPVNRCIKSTSSLVSSWFLSLVLTPSRHKKGPPWSEREEYLSVDLSVICFQ